MIEGLRGDLPITGIFREEVINQNSYYKWEMELRKAAITDFVEYNNHVRQERVYTPG